MATKTAPSNFDDILDSRSIIERIEELESDEERTDEENEELATLTALADEGSGVSPDWEYGETLIRDSYFETYAQELAEELDLVKSDATWPAYCIDWERAANDLKADYSSVDFGGVDYWVRS